MPTVALVAGCAAAAVPVGAYLERRATSRYLSCEAPARVGAAAAMTALVWTLLAWRLGPQPALPAFLAVAALGVPLARVDLAVHRLPDPLTRPALALAGVLLVVAALAGAGAAPLAHGLAGAAGLFAVYLVLALVRPGALGFGDVKLAAVLGLLLGWLGGRTWFVGLTAGYVIAAGLGAFLLVTRRAGRRSLMPFGPAMLLGALLAVVVFAPPS